MGWMLVLSGTLALMSCDDGNGPEGVSWLCLDQTCSHVNTSFDLACGDHGGKSCNYYETQDDCIGNVDGMQYMCEE
jgi:hypothetical protein